MSNVAFISGIVAIMCLLVATPRQVKQMEHFIGSMHSMPLLKNDNMPLFLNFYPTNIGEDFNLYDFISKLKLNNEPSIQGLPVINGSRKLFKDKQLPPVIIIPGLGCTPIYAMWKKVGDNIRVTSESGEFDKTDQWSCRQFQDTFTKVWPNTVNACWANVISVKPSKNGVDNQEGVTTTTDEFGTMNFGPVMDNLISTLDALGYTEGENLFGAGYDFRKITDQKELDNWCMSLTKLIERTSAIHKLPVVLLGHDVGSMIANYFLVTAVPGWKQKFIKSFITVNGAFGGCPKALRAVLSGSDVPYASAQERLTFTNATRNFGALSLMIPDPSIYLDKPLVHFNNVTYTGHDVPKLLARVSPELAQSFAQCSDIRKKCMLPPRVPVCMILGDDLSTENSYKYGKTLYDDPVKNYPFYNMDLPSNQHYDYSKLYVGDGTMPRFALEYPIVWSKYQQEPVYYKFFPGAEHSKILSMNDPVQQIIRVILQ